MANEITTQPALLIQNAYKWKQANNKTVLVAANGHVTLTPIEDVDIAMQFTPEQWQQIVEFVELQTWQPDWDSIDEEFIYVTRDKYDSTLWAYTKPPICHAESWEPNGDDQACSLPDIECNTEIPWTTLFVRPSGA